MNIEDAIHKFRDAHPRLNFSDTPSILHAAEELGLGEAEFEITDDYIADSDLDLMHIHPTMIVSRQAFSGSKPTSAYATYPHQKNLGGWTNSDNIGRTSSARQGRCNCNDGAQLDQPSGTPCMYCEQQVP